MGMNPCLGSGFAALLAVSIPGQSGHVVPKTLATVEGGSASNLPFGTSGPMRYQVIYNAEELPFAAPVQLSRLYIRPDGLTSAIAQKQFATLTMRMSTTFARAEAASPNFDKNHGVDAHIVQTAFNLALPARPASTPVPVPRQYWTYIPFAQASFFDLTPVRTPYGQQTKGLALEMLIVSQPSGSYPIDSPAGCKSQVRWFGKQGPRCVTSGNRQPLHLGISESIQAGSPVTFTVDEAPPGVPFAVVLGGGETGTWSGQPLPVDLTLLGGWDCYVNVEFLVGLIGVADGQGVGRLKLDLPSSRGIVGLEIFAQAIVQDIGANPLKHSTSLGVRGDVCGPLGVARVYATGSYTAVTGIVSYGEALILELQ